MTDNTQDSATSTPESQETQPTVPSLQLTDLVLALQVVQSAAQRGAIRAEEMSAVGGLHDRLFAFLEAQGVITRQQQQPAGDTENA